VEKRQRRKKKCKLLRAAGVKTRKAEAIGCVNRKRKAQQKYKDR